MLLCVYTESYWKPNFLYCIYMHVSAYTANKVDSKNISHQNKHAGQKSQRCT